jgi:hypothetical protein
MAHRAADFDVTGGVNRSVRPVRLIIFAGTRHPTMP